MFSHRSLALAVICVLGCAIWSCDDAPRPVAPHASHQDAGAMRSVSSAALSADVNRQLAALRQLTAPYHDLARAKADGWSTPITDCLESESGGMGFHYGNIAYIDGEANASKPELFVYEPQSNGRLRLVAVEYIVPLSAWTGSEPPMLFGQQFHVNSAFGVWALHVWLWRENPSGIFADWNPMVSCKAAS